MDDLIRILFGFGSIKLKYFNDFILVSIVVAAKMSMGCFDQNLCHTCFYVSHWFFLREHHLVELHGMGHFRMGKVSSILLAINAEVCVSTC